MKQAIAILVFVETLQILITNAQDNEAPNDFLVSKWKDWYKTLDVDHAGTILPEYVVESRNTFSELHHLAGDEKKSAEEAFEKWWNDCIFHGKYGNISEKEFVDGLTKKYMADKLKFSQTMQECSEMIYNVMDADGDGSVSEEEYVILLEAYGHENVELDTPLFEAYKPVDGHVPVEELVASWVDFTTSQYETKPSVEKSYIEQGV